MRAFGIFRPVAPTSADIDPDHVAASTPRVLWIELTSKCPFDCVFCSRRTLRGDGEHMDLDMYRRLLADLDRPEIIRLNYSGESLHYPALLDAIALAKRTGAFVELVTALASASDAVVRGLVTSGLDRLTVSLHALSDDRFRAIYRLASAAKMRDRLALLQATQRELGRAQPFLDFAFVAMADNLDELAAVAVYAASLGVRDIAVHPLLRRDEIPLPFAAEQEGNRLRPQFKAQLGAAIAAAAAAAPQVSIAVSSPVLAADVPLSATPQPWPGDLPAGARVHACDQSPWDTAHVLADGTVVACEVLDRVPLGSLRHASLRAIWHGDAYRSFRRRYVKGDVEGCRSCPWKHAHRPAPLRRRVAAPFTPAASAGQEFVLGWHAPEAALVWSKPEATLVLGNVPAARHLLVDGMLPAAAGGNALRITCDGQPAGTIANVGKGTQPFNSRIALPLSRAPQRTLRFTVDAVTCPLRDGTGADCRILGFALHAATLC